CNLLVYAASARRIYHSVRWVHSASGTLTERLGRFLFLSSYGCACPLGNRWFPRDKLTSLGSRDRAALASSSWLAIILVMLGRSDTQTGSQINSAEAPSMLCKRCRVFLIPSQEGCMHRNEDVLMLDNDPLWYQDAVIYELHVRTFHDSDRDGIGDFRGLTQKLDYLQDLGVTTLWLLPFCASPL